MRIKVYTQKLYAVIIAYMLSFSAFLNLVNGILNSIGLQTVLDTVLLYGGMFGLLLMGFALMLTHSKHLEIDVLLLVSFFSMYYIISLLIFPENKSFLFTSWTDYAKNPIYSIFLYSLPGYIFARKLHDYEYFKLIMRRFSYVVVSMSIIVFFLARDTSASQYMTFSYNMLTQLLTLIFFSPKKHPLIHYLIVVLGFISFSLGGSRGALISLIMAAVWICVATLKNKKSLLVVSLILIPGMFITILKDEILLLLTDFLEYLSIDSRSIQYVINGNFFDDSGRLSIYAAAKQSIGIMGKGFMGDRVAIDIYPHNLILEVLIQFGVLFGTVLVVVLLVFVGHALLSRKTPEYVWIVVLLPCGFLKLMITGSYLNQEPAFYIFLGFCINAVMRNQHANTNGKYSICGGKYR